MNCFKTLFIIGFLTICLNVVNGQQNMTDDEPVLVVGIVIDQMKMNYLWRFEHKFGEDGFKRLMREGFSYTNCQYSYAPTYTGPGHASIYTGTTPSIHGIIGNNWYIPKEQKSVYCVDDENYKELGSEDEKGKSPHRLLATTMTDELALMSNERSKIFTISIKDRGAVLPGGHMANAAYWLNKNAHFVSSDYYMETLPSWVNGFNEEKIYAKYLAQPWTTSLPIDSYDESLADDNPYESKFLGKKKPVFPYNVGEEVGRSGVKIIRATPYGNDLLMDFAERLIEKEKLTQPATNWPNFLAISFSSPDYVGHAMGPRSIELEDTYIKLDARIGEFLNYLDQQVGKGKYLLFLTADHGAAENPQYLADRGFKTKSIGFSKVKDYLKDWSMERYGQNVIADVSNNNIYVNNEVIENLKLVKVDVVDALRTFLLEFPEIKRVYNHEQIQRGSEHTPYMSMFIKGFNPKESGDLIILPEYGFITYKNTGTTHGTPYNYDTHVPMLLYGWGIKPGTSKRKKFITQLAPTITQLIKVGLPSGSIDDVLYECMQD